jgi:phage tail sheath protein FI
VAVAPQVSYPGVYIQEVDSGVHTVTPVPTSITAFLGRTQRGPVNEPTLFTSIGQFTTLFGGLAADMPLTYAVYDYYQNGGSDAVIVRLTHEPHLAELATSEPKTTKGKTVPLATAGSAAAAASADLNLEASSVGIWGNQLQIMVDKKGITAELAQKYIDPDSTGDGVAAADLFNLTVKNESPGGSIECIQNVHLKEGRRRLDRVLKQESLLVRVKETDGSPDMPTEIPESQNDAFGDKFTGGKSSAGLVAADYKGNPATQTGIYALDKADLFTLMCIPPDTRDSDTDPSVYQAAMAYCYNRRAMLIVDPPIAWGKVAATAAANAKDGLAGLGLSGEAARNAALYFPRVVRPDSMRRNQPDVFPPSGIIAGIMARTDSTRGVWKAPAGGDAALADIQGLQVNLSDEDNGQLNPLGINCLRNFRAYGNVVWGARTLRGSDQLDDDYKYVPVRRLMLMIEETLYRSTQWAVFEPNDEPLWSQLRLNIGAFMHDLFRQGAFQGQSAQDAYFVRCDSSTTTQSDIKKGIVNIMVGFAPLKPAEFVVIHIQQIAGNIAT